MFLGSMVLQLGYTLRSCEELVENIDAWSPQYILNQVIAGAQASAILKSAVSICYQLCSLEFITFHL